jgi:putative transposase
MVSSCAKGILPQKEMPNTYTQVHLHVVFAVKYRRALIYAEWKDRLHHYMIGILHQHGHRVLALNSMPDHVHLLFGYNIRQALPDLMLNLKRDSSAWINKQGLAPIRFAWQEGYGAFAVSRRHVSRVATYILNQEEHHAGMPFSKEYCELLRLEGIEYLPQYLFRDPE